MARKAFPLPERKFNLFSVASILGGSSSTPACIKRDVSQAEIEDYLDRMCDGKVYRPEHYKVTEIQEVEIPILVRKNPTHRLGA